LPLLDIELTVEKLYIILDGFVWIAIDLALKFNNIGGATFSMSAVRAWVCNEGEFCICEISHRVFIFQGRISTHFLNHSGELLLFGGDELFEQLQHHVHPDAGRQLSTPYTQDLESGDLPLSELCRPLVNGIQFQVSRVNTDGGVDGQGKLEFFPSLREDADELKKPPFPDGPSKDFDEDLFPDSHLSRDTRN
jgi:hypothetical protein